jgi:hypothetical protein
MSSAEQQYAQEQAKLGREHTGTADDIRIEAPKPPEVNPELLKDVEPLLFRGFLYVPAEINGVNFVFKSLNHHEYERLLLTVNPSGRKGRSDFYNYFLAFGVLMIDGVNILPDRERWIPEIADTFKQFEDKSKSRVVRNLSEVNRRASRAVLLTDVFAMDPQSRLRWAQYQKLDLTSSAVTGFAGTEALGLNWGQLTWRAINFYEDHHEQIEREWENTKFVAGAFAGSKGLAPINNRDKQRREKERDERLARRDKLLRAAFLNESLTSTTTKNGAPVQVARTVEELADQLEKDLRGEKDWHDQVVEAQENRVKERYNERMQALEAIQEKHIEQYGPSPVVGGTEAFAGLSPDEVQQRIAARQQRVSQRMAAAQRFPEAFDPKLSKFMDKWHESSTTEVVPAIVTKRPPGKPFRRGGE